MKSIVAAVAAITVLGLAGAAGAAETQGTIIAIDNFNKITLNDGKVFKLGTGLKSTSLKKGDNVKIGWFTYEQGFRYAVSLSVQNGR